MIGIFSPYDGITHKDVPSMPPPLLASDFETQCRVETIEAIAIFAHALPKHILLSSGITILVAGGIRVGKSLVMDVIRSTLEDGGRPLSIPYAEKAMIEKIPAEACARTLKEKVMIQGHEKTVTCYHMGTEIVTRDNEDVRESFQTGDLRFFFSFSSQPYLSPDIIISVHGYPSEQTRRHKIQIYDAKFNDECMRSTLRNLSGRYASKPDHPYGTRGLLPIVNLYP